MEIADVRRKNLEVLIGDVKKRGTVAKFARRWDLDVTYLRQLLSGHRTFGEKAAKKIEDRLQLKAGFFGESLQDESSQLASIKSQFQKGSKDTELEIVQYNVGGSMGNGRLILEEGQPGVIKSWTVDHEWLRLNVRHYTSVSNLCIVTGFGPSMRPRFNPGDPLLMDSGIKSVDSDGVYFFRVGESGYIKQLQRIPTELGTIYRAKSYNPDYEPFDITKKMDFEVFGKILTIWKSEQV
jgi:phage repressor protein C with HTH and peptisase S24 domain